MKVIAELKVRKIQPFPIWVKMEKKTAKRSQLHQLFARIFVHISTTSRMRRMIIQPILTSHFGMIL